MKHSGKAYLKVVGVNRLPTPFEITGDPAWGVGGQLYKLYDLELDTDGGDLLSDDSTEGVDLNTLDDSEGVENKQKYNAPEGCVKVFNTKSNQEVKDLVQESTRNQSLEDFDPNDAETLKLFEEINDGLIPYVPQDNSLPN